MNAAELTIRAPFIKAAIAFGPRFFLRFSFFFCVSEQITFAAARELYEPLCFTVKVQLALGTVGGLNFYSASNNNIQ